MAKNLKYIFVYLLLNGFFMFAQLRAIDNFFTDLNGDLTKITWAHAVNSRALLDNALKNNSIMMLEADISMGKVNNTGNEVPIMAHPPAKISDLSLQEFLDSVDKFNKDAKDDITKKGVKLDFKSIEVFENSLDIVKGIYDKFDYPIWINADIIKGPVNASNPVDANRFLIRAKDFTKSVLSLGWTTRYGKEENIKEASYSNDQIREMIEVINANDVTQDITLAVRAGIAAESSEQMKTLKNNVTNSTLTVWSSEGDYVNVSKLRDVIFDYGLDRVYVDVPQELRDKLHLGSSACRLSASLILIVSILAFGRQFLF